MIQTNYETYMLRVEIGYEHLPPTLRAPIARHKVSKGMEEGLPSYRIPGFWNLSVKREWGICIYVYEEYAYM